MRCKVGDLAVGVSAAPTKTHNIGILVRVVAPHEPRCGYWVVRVLAPFTADGVAYAAGSEAIAKDRRLRPIRGDEGEDEILRIAGYPMKETA